MMLESFHLFCRHAQSCLTVCVYYLLLLSVCVSDQQGIIFEGNELFDSCTFTHYGIQQGSILWIVLKLTGGKQHEQDVEGRTKNPKTQSMENLADM